MGQTVDLNAKRQLRLETVEKFVIPPQHGWAHELRANQFIKVEDPRGRQCGDFWAFNKDDLTEHLSAMHTRVWVNKLCPVPGESFHTNHRRPILQVIEDTCGVHDLLTAACDCHRYRLYGLQTDHRSCTSNLEEVIKPYLGAHTFYTPQPFNIFANVPIGADGAVMNGPSPSKPGDRIIMRAWIDQIVAISACPQEFNPITGWFPTELNIEILEAAEGEYV